MSVVSQIIIAAAASLGVQVSVRHRDSWGAIMNLFIYLCLNSFAAVHLTVDKTRAYKSSCAQLSPFLLDAATSGSPRMGRDMK